MYAVKMYLKVIGLFYLIVEIPLIVISLIICNAFELEYLTVLKVILSVLIAGIPVSVLFLLIGTVKEYRSSYGKLNQEFKKELRTNGYTKRFFELSDRAIESRKEMDFVYFKDFIIYTADYYNIIGNSEKALEICNLTSESMFTNKDLVFLDHGYSALLYFGVMMEAYRNLGLRHNAEELMERAKPFLDKNYKEEFFNFLSDHIYFTYSFLAEDYDSARKYSDKLMSYQSDDSGKYFTKYFCKAELDKHFGDINGARDAMNSINMLSGKKHSPGIRFTYDRMMERLGLPD